MKGNRNKKKKGKSATSDSGTPSGEQALAPAIPPLPIHIDEVNEVNEERDEDFINAYILEQVDRWAQRWFGADSGNHVTSVFWQNSFKRVLRASLYRLGKELFYFGFSLGTQYTAQKQQPRKIQPVQSVNVKPVHVTPTAPRPLPRSKPSSSRLLPSRQFTSALVRGEHPRDGSGF